MKMDVLGITKEKVEKAIQKGMKWKEIQSKKWHANMAGIEVVFEKEGEEIFIITTYEN